MLKLAVNIACFKVLSIQYLSYDHVVKLRVELHLFYFFKAERKNSNFRASYTIFYFKI